MIFSSFTFLCYFLPVVFCTYYLLPNKARNLFLLCASLFFYAWGNPSHLTLLCFLILTGYGAVYFIEKFPKYASKICIGFVFYILGIFFFFKYGDFSIATYNQLANKKTDLIGILMPLGISFYVFQLISYIVDVYRHQAVAQKNLLTLSLYISSFPQLIAGPIVRYDTIARQLVCRRHSLLKIYQGLRRFIIGLSKKVIIADLLGTFVDRIFNESITALTPTIAWFGIILYALQIYYDFSGYSDMAIGLGRMFGFRFLENFNYPYISRSISEFWRRWHISLSSWFKSYVYIPLGGNRKGLFRTCINLLFVFLLTGFWHGASWTFVVWGLWYGFFIVLEKIMKKLFHNNKIGPCGKVVFNLFGRVYTVFVVLIGWVFFRAENLETAWQYLRLMFNQRPFDQFYGFSYYFQGMGWIVLGVALLAMTGLFKNLLNIKGFFAHFCINVFLLSCFMLVIVLLTSNSYSPFIYFRF